MAATDPAPTSTGIPLLVTTTAQIVLVVAVSLSLYQLYTAGIAALTALVQRSIHLGAILVLTFLLKPAFASARKDRLNGWVMIDWLLVAASIYCTAYICINLTEIFERQGDWLPADLMVGIVGTLLVLEACRRVIGGIMTGICVTAMLYAYFGPWMPELIIHKGYSIERITTTLWLTTEGIFGLPIGVAATFVFVFVLFGAFLESTGGGNFFIELAYALTGRFSGGPAKTSVVASGFMGSVSGSAVGNVVATGSFTIPMMKKVGYRPHVAGAIEAAASTGGQLMPPIMGAGAFLMAEFTNTSYLTIIKVALVPAIMYYVTVLFFVHYEAKKYGLVGQPKESLPRVGKVVKEGLHFIIPVLILVYVLVNNYSPMMAGFVAVVSTAAASLTANAVRWAVAPQMIDMGKKRPTAVAFCLDELKSIVKALEKGAKNAIMVSVACAAAGIIVGMVTLTGMGLKFSSLVLDLSYGIKALAILLIGAASLVLGMGLPVTASYIVLATLAGPALLDMGVPIMVSHMIVFWYSQDANVTPPVSLASFAGAGIAGANPMRTAFTSWKLAKGLYIIPIIMAYRPLLGMGTDYELLHWQVGLTMATTMIGLISFASAIERYFIRRATWPETLLFWIAAAGLFWPQYWADGLGLIAFAAAVAMQKRTTSTS
ncbi:TRAP transporter permease [Desulfosarcina sp.]|uniref:TRAP transporter permease n=1 Tax=Desulfosarcina sp. TaxID=2027861 RepID=UPI0029B1F27D|nr:TRAP transporter permease [Desulfosarcina sp.]MDX2452172.1 TRAP transporter permease [Desulfosarcina sp.]MDX2489965.1 TRAP transporter permease [Desulfosarcina sp.]